MRIGFSTLVALTVIAPAAILLSGCSADPESAPTASISSATPSETTPESQRIERPVVLTSDTSQSPAKSPAEWKTRVLVKTSMGDITLELDAEKAPVTVDNFLNGYVERGFYSETIVHHVDPSSLIAIGGYTADLEEKPVQAAIRCEAQNGLSNVRGAVAMARHPEYPDSATSQFMIHVADNSSLDYQSDDDSASFGYCVFGKVVAGLDVVDRIVAVPAASQGDFPAVPSTPVVIHSIERLE